MTAKEINAKLIKDVTSAINNVLNAYNGEFKVKKFEDGTDRVGNTSFMLTSKEWLKGACIRFSMDHCSEFIGDPSDPLYWACCQMGFLVDPTHDIGFKGVKYSVGITGNKKDVGKFVENLFLPIAIKILKFAKANKRKYPTADRKKMKAFLEQIFYKGTISKIPTEEQIAQMFKLASDEKETKAKKEFARKIDDWFISNYPPYHTTSKQDKELEAIAKGTSDKPFLRMLKDLRMDNIDDETKDAAKEVLIRNIRDFFADQHRPLK